MTALLLVGGQSGPAGVSSATTYKGDDAPHKAPGGVALLHNVMPAWGRASAF
jgi:hypothetical protein